MIRQWPGLFTSLLSLDGALTDKQLLVRMLKGYYGGWVIAPERWAFTTVGADLVDFEGMYGWWPVDAEDFLGIDHSTRLSHTAKKYSGAATKQYVVASFVVARDPTSTT